jgi:hypothetical protein
MRKMIKGVVLTGATVSLLAAGMATASAAPNSGANQGTQTRGGAGNSFAVTCDFSHSGRVDPIVMPGMAMMSHLHQFFGNTTTNENSTGASLLSGGTTCSEQNDLSAYWFPALYQDDVLVEPTTLRARYARLGGNVTAFPQGFMAVTGRSDSTARWGCNSGGRTTFSSTLSDVPTCEGGSRLVAEVKFGDCWDGTSLDSDDHASHLVASTNGANGRPECPSTHPVHVPEVTLQAQYPAAATGGAGVTLASGGPTTLHADIFEAWAGNSLQNRVGRVQTTGANRGPQQQDAGAATNGNANGQNRPNALNNGNQGNVNGQQGPGRNRGPRQNNNAGVNNAGVNNAGVNGRAGTAGNAQGAKDCNKDDAGSTTTPTPSTPAPAPAPAPMPS